MKRWLEYLAARIALGTLRWAPLPVAERLSHAYAGLLDRALPRLRRTAYQNLAMALPEVEAHRV
ncbi:MAG: lipid A biosynthesis acyltransferase, partial [Bryobacteraceae bacterium]|nr:lipid A biosynthesis acyltransferase [Bryobacteraceae bacterium]